MSNSKNGVIDMLTKEEFKYLDNIISRHLDRPAPLMLILSDIQKTFGCVSCASQKYISKKTGISYSKIYGIITFYSQFSVKPSGKHIIGVCMGTACYVKGATHIFKKVVDVLDIGLGETTKDGLFTMTPTRCLGDCSKAPAIIIDDEVYGNLTTDEVEEIIRKHK